MLPYGGKALLCLQPSAYCALAVMLMAFADLALFEARTFSEGTCSRQESFQRKRQAQQAVRNYCVSHMLAPVCMQQHAGAGVCIYSCKPLSAAAAVLLCGAAALQVRPAGLTSPSSFSRNMKNRTLLVLNPWPHKTLFLSYLHIPHKAQCLEDADEVPGGVNLPPLQAVARRVGEGVVGVVPALSKAHGSNPPAVGGQVSCSTAQHGRAAVC